MCELWGAKCCTGLQNTKWITWLIVLQFRDDGQRQAGLKINSTFMMNLGYSSSPAMRKPRIKSIDFCRSCCVCLPTRLGGGRMRRLAKSVAKIHRDKEVRQNWHTKIRPAHFFSTSKRNHVLRTIGKLKICGSVKTNYFFGTTRRLILNLVLWMEPIYSFVLTPLITYIMLSCVLHLKIVG